MKLRGERDERLISKAVPQLRDRFPKPGACFEGS